MKHLLKNIVNNRKRNSFIYFGRLLPQKGLLELLPFFENNTECTLTIIGNGKLENDIQQYADKQKNIILKPKVTDKSILALELSKHEYVILNAKKSKKWEELFGMMLIEGMAQGLIPIASKHSGPNEIISNDFGYLFEEGKILEMLPEIIKTPNFDTHKSEQAMLASKAYLPSTIANLWKPILEKL